MAFLTITDPGPSKLQLLVKLRPLLIGITLAELTRLVDGRLEYHLTKPQDWTEAAWDVHLDALGNLLEIEGASFDIDECRCDLDGNPSPEEMQLRVAGAAGKLIGLGGYLN